MWGKKKHGLKKSAKSGLCLNQSDNLKLTKEKFSENNVSGFQVIFTFFYL